MLKLIGLSIAVEVTNFGIDCTQYKYLLIRWYIYILISVKRYLYYCIIHMIIIPIYTLPI